MPGPTATGPTATSPRRADPDATATATLPERVRATCAAVADGATLVRLDTEAVDRYARALLIADDRTGPAGVAGVAGFDVPQIPDAWLLGDHERRTGLVLALDAVNFGSGWHPVLRKRPGLSGARTVAAAFTEWWIAADWPSPERLMELLGGTGGSGAVGAAMLSGALGQPPGGEARRLVELFVASLTELAHWVEERHDGAWSAVPAAATGSAARLAGLLATVPYWDDRARHPAVGDGQVWLFKRAQIAAADLALAGVVDFVDLDRLTCMADNLIPHVLRLDGVLVVDPAVVARIERGELLTQGEQAEVELRAVAVHAVEQLVSVLGSLGHHLTPAEVDRRLWWRGRLPRYKAVPRHRCRTTAY